MAFQQSAGHIVPSVMGHSINAVGNAAHYREKGKPPIYLWAYIDGNFELNKMESNAIGGVATDRKLCIFKTRKGHGKIQEAIERESYALV